MSADSHNKAKTYIFGNNVTKFYCSERKLLNYLFYLGEKKSNKCKYYLSSTSIIYIHITYFSFLTEFLGQTIKTKTNKHLLLLECCIVSGFHNKWHQNWPEKLLLYLSQEKTGFHVQQYSWRPILLTFDNAYSFDRKKIKTIHSTAKQTLHWNDICKE